MSEKPTEESFLKDVSEHQMTLLHDEGVYRHLFFAVPGTICQSFNLVTGPGFLLYRGDMGCFEFERTRDMFKFFRTSENDFNYKGPDKLSINPHYWSEKVEAADKRGDGVQQFSHEVFERLVRELAKSFIDGGELFINKQDGNDVDDESEQNYLIDQFNSEIETLIESVGDGQSAYNAITAYEFSYFNLEASDVFGQDAWEYDFNDYTFRYLWCCYAIAWGVKQYDQFKEEQQCLTNSKLSTKVSKLFRKFWSIFRHK